MSVVGTDMPLDDVIVCGLELVGWIGICDIGARRKRHLRQESLLVVVFEKVILAVGQIDAHQVMPDLNDSGRRLQRVINILRLEIELRVNERDHDN